MIQVRGLPDTIAAIASPPGRGAVGIVRASGPEVPRLAVELLGALPGPRVAVLTRFRDAGGETLDQGLALYFPSPGSFTGEDVLELQGHGGPLIMDLLLRRLLSLGCRLARPGEFSERAFLNGKLDLAQAEAVADLIEAGSAAAARAAVRSMCGEFSARILALQARLTELRVQVEAAIDFPDEDIDVLARAGVTERIAELMAAFQSLEAAARQGALLREGLTVVIAGKPNAGKSSLLNRLVGDDVAIVTERPGTTRDLLRHEVHLDGLPLTLIDTAGLRTATDVVEAEGIRRARAEIERADRVLYVVDGSGGGLEGGAPVAQGSAGAAAYAAARAAARATLGAVPAHVPITVVINKIDLMGSVARPIGQEPGDLEGGAPCALLYVSALHGDGMESLRAHLKHSAGYRDADSSALSARRRHVDALARAHALVLGAAAVAATGAVELLAEDLKLAQQALGTITGEFSSDDLLGEIFGSFCIGK